ncbi:MAG: AAA family ATPase [Deltaproteobacteria bacterium]|nr:AAA family ATPase [Deltaproteobacteria bacterium]
MYLSFYHLQQKPFLISTDPGFLWLGEKHEEALATLKYGVLDNKGFLLLTGDIGTGKTTLVNALLNTLKNDTLVATVRDPSLELLDFYNYIAHCFQLGATFTSKGAFLIRFEQFLHETYHANKKVLLIIDEAQRISQELLEEVRLLSNIEREDSKLLNIFFVGQLEFNEILLRPENRPIRQRITVNYTIAPLTEKETGEYIKHRLAVAGAEKSIFPARTVREVFSFSQGYPRLINIICDRSLLTGFVEESTIITAGIIKECMEELKIPQPKSDRQPFRPPLRQAPEEKETGNEPEPQAALPTRPPADPESKDKRRLAGLGVWAAFVVVLLTVGYFSLSQQGARALREYPAVGYVQGIWQDVVSWVETKGAFEPRKTGSPPVGSVSSDGGVAGAGKQVEGGRPLPYQPGKIPKKSTVNGTEPAPAERTHAAAVPAPGESPVSSADDSAGPSPEAEHGGAKVTSDHKKEENNGSVSGKMERSRQPVEASAVDGKQRPATNAADQSLPVLSMEKLVIPFPFDSNFPSGQSLEKLNMLIDTLLRRPSLRIIIRGFTDSLGNERYNKKLAEFRANSIKSYMVGRGLAETRIITKGLGPETPIASNETSAGREANRRVEIEILNP